jgi:hypothetical protein
MMSSAFSVTGWQSNAGPKPFSSNNLLKYLSAIVFIQDFLLI